MASLRKTRPGAMTRSGASSVPGTAAPATAASRARIWTGDVWVRSRTPFPSGGGGSRKNVVLHVPRRVLGREVEGREVVPVVLDLGPALHGEAEAREGRLDVGEGLRERVDGAGRDGRGDAAGEREVERRRAGRAGRPRVGRLEAPLGGRLERVEALPEVTALVWRRLAHTAEERRHGAGLAPQEAHAERLGRLRRVDRSRLDVGEHGGDVGGHGTGKWGLGTGRRKRGRRPNLPVPVSYSPVPSHKISRPAQGPSGSGSSQPRGSAER